MSLCNCLGQLNVKWDDLEFIYVSRIFIQAANKMESCTTLQWLSGKGPETFNWKVGNREEEKEEAEGKRGRMLLQYLRLRGGKGETSSKIGCFTLKCVVGLCAAQNPPILRLSGFLYCHVCSLCFHGLILDAWVESFGPGERKSEGIGIRQRRSCIFRLAVNMDWCHWHQKYSTESSWYLDM